MKPQFVFPNLLTALSLSCGLFVIFKMNMIHPGTAVIEQVTSCVRILLFAAVCDLLDGTVARAMNAKSEFGIFFDSMADGVSFGVAPSVVVLKTLSAVPGTVVSAFLTSGAMIFSVAGILRLVRFSTAASLDENKPKIAFHGLPITCAGLAAISPTFFLMSIDLENDMARALIAIFVFCSLGYLMVSTWQFPSLKVINVRFSSFHLLITLVAFFSLILFMILQNFAAALLVFTWGYVFGSWVYACYTQTSLKI